MTGKTNLTPVIDIVFLLLIFLVIVYQRLESQNFPVSLPNVDDRLWQEDKQNRLTAAVFGKDGRINYSFGGETCPFERPQQISVWLMERIDRASAESGLKTVCLRIDKDIEYRYVQPVLSACSQSSVANFQIASEPQR